MLLWPVIGLALVPKALTSPSVWPEPITLQSGNDVFWVDPDIRARVSCGNSTDIGAIIDSSVGLSVYERTQRMLSAALERWQVSSGFSSVDDTKEQDDTPFSEQDYLRSAILSALTNITTTNLVPWKFHSRGSDFEPLGTTEAPKLEELTILQSVCPSAGFHPGDFFDGDESYTLKIQDGAVSITSNSSIGTMNALQTLKQLFYMHSKNRKVYTPHAPVFIEDRPHWRYRGISLDIARNSFAVDDVLRTITTMATVKLNRLHVHATDSQSWPIDIPSLPELAKKGAYQPHLVWSAQDLAHVQKYGVSHGVQVFLELDMPGHTASIAHAYPDMIAGFNQPDWSTFAAEPLSGQLKLNSSRVNDFLDALFEDLLPRLSRYSSIYHLGGDEVNRMVHVLDETVHSSDHTVLQPLIQAIMQRIYSHAVKHNLHPMIWEEMILEWNLTFSPPASSPSAPTHHLHSHLHSLADQPTPKPLVQAWRSSSTITRLLSTNNRVIFGDSQHWYLDCGHGEFYSPYPSGYSPPGVPYNTSGGTPTKLAPPYLDYCGPYHNWKAIYTFDPLANISKELWNGIEGGETLLWSELTDSVDLDVKLWPRAAAAAEVLWRGPRQPGQLVDATRRLAVWRERVVRDLGVRSGNVQMTWCLMEGGCEL